MVISHKYRYVFVQTPKTASSAIAKELCENYSGEMILTKHASFDEFYLQANDDEKTYFSFAGVRNPLDVAVSRYVLRKSGRGRPGKSNHEQVKWIKSNDADFNQYFSEFIKKRKRYGIGIVPKNWQSQSFESINYIYHYENIPQEFSKILHSIGINPVRELPLVNKTQGKTFYLEYYNKKNLRLAYKIFRNYMERWGYEIPWEYRRTIWLRWLSGI